MNSNMLEYEWELEYECEPFKKFNLNDFDSV